MNFQLTNRPEENDIAFSGIAHYLFHDRNSIANTTTHETRRTQDL